MQSSSDHEGSKFGMWLFLYTEIMLFGGLFVLYAVYYHKFTDDFIAGGQQLDTFLGTLNTVILLISSFAVAGAITAIQNNSKKITIILLSSSLLCGFLFLINKFIEWSHKFEVGIYPNSEKLLDSDPGLNIFFGLYYVITGLHGVHIIIGMALLLWSLLRVKTKHITGRNYVLLENAGLYWHLVDLIWIFIFPLFYLIL